MKNSACLLLTLVLGVGFLNSVACAAEEKSKPAPAITEAAVEAAWQRRLPEIDFGNVPLAEVAKDLTDQFRGINFVVPESARGEPVPHLILRNVTLNEILKAIEIASEGRIHSAPSNTGISIDPATGLPVTTRAENSQRNLVAFSIAPLPGYPTAAREKPTCRVFSLAPYLAYKSERDAQRAVKELYDALHVAWSMLKKYQRDVQEPTLTIHEGTKLLIAVGRAEELAVIDQVVKQLQGGSPIRKATPQGEHESKPEPEKPKPASPATRQ
jgi:hypothetical protein